VRLGIHLPQFREPVPGEVLAGAARAAEEAGADDLWVSDHLILPVGSTRPPASFHDPLTVLTWAAAVTERAALGTSVLVAPYRHPVVLAKALASLDALSGGRVVLGVASGWMESEFAALGVPFGERGARTDEAIAVCRALWAGETSFAGRWTRFDGLELLPRPARAGGPPVWVGGNSDAAIRRAARLGDAWHTTVSEPERLPERIAALERELGEAGRSRAELTLSVRVRATAERMAVLAPRLRELGVDHVLVDPPAFAAERVADEVAALRDLV
jgi:probable F420-dependent oxidoreductase